MKNATIKDVANLAGVSIKTVSRVLNREPKVRKNTRERVFEAMAQLKYSPNTSARRLAGNRTYMLGLLYDDRSPGYVTSIQGGVLEACSNDHFDVLIYPCRTNNPSLLSDITDLISSGKVDGLLLTPPISDVVAVRKLTDKLSVPNVVISLGHNSESHWTVDTNDREASSQMVHYLASLGHKRIAFIMGHPDHIAVNQRFVGFQDGMQASGLKVLKSNCLQGYNSFESGLECGKRLLTRKQPPTTVFCANDEMAAGVCRIANEMSIAIPTDLSIVGFDDIPLASQLLPALTTIRQPTHAMAKLATELLIMRLRGESPEGVKRVLKSELVFRNSTGPVPANQ